MEVEYYTNDNVDIKKVKQEIQSIIDQMNLIVSEELNMGKPEMFMKRHHINIINQ